MSPKELASPLPRNPGHKTSRVSAMGNSSPQEIQDFLQLSYQIFSQDWKITDNNHAILYYKIQSVYMSVRNRLPNYAYYGDEAFTGDSMGLD